MPRGTAVIKRQSLEQLIKSYPNVQLATLVDQPPSGAGWLHEVKFDGYRLLGYRAGERVSLRTRNGNDWTAKFPSIEAGLKRLPVRDAVIDMEAVIVDAKGGTSFQALQAALGVGGDAESIVAYAFDLLEVDGHDLTGEALTDRKKRLRSLLGAGKGTLRYSDHVVGQGRRMSSRACSMGLEGIVSKQCEGPYEPGRGSKWLKVKCTKRQEFIILGYSPPRSGERAFGALYIGYRMRGALQFAGKVGTGFSMQNARELRARLDRNAVEDAVISRAGAAGLTAAEWRTIQWVKPVLLCEVAFTEWTSDGKVRHPSFQGLREDKDAKDVKKETPVHGIVITHPDRVISEIGHITKGELAEYYSQVSPFILPEITGRPISLLRCPTGIDGQCFYQRNPGRGLGPDVYPFEFRHKGKTYEYLYIQDEKGLIEIVQMGGIEIHPWGARIDAIDYPDRLIFDLDPAPEVNFDAVKMGAEDLRQRLRERGMESRVKCTGGKGLHVIVQLAGKDRWPMVKAFAAAVAAEMVADVPEAYIATMSKAKRAGKIFIDYFRNDYTATAIADYSVRARPGAPVALPLEWNELKVLKAANQFTIKDVLKRMKRKAAATRQERYRIPE